jgi:Raf kinase inhibitor-like YbhB/YbcL family protein
MRGSALFVRPVAGLLSVCPLILAVFAARVPAFEVEPPDPTRCDDLVLAVTRSFTSDCAWSATAVIVREGSVIDVALEVHAGGEICLPVAREKTFRVPLGSYPPGAYTIRVAWTDLDQVPEEKEISIADAATCPEKILRGDSNGDGAVDLADAVFVLLHLYAGGDPPGCPAAADADSNGNLEITDPLAILYFLFLSGPPLLPLSREEAEACRSAAPFVLTSAAFGEGETIPVKYTCDGTKVSPPLAWTGAPAGTRSFALTCLDPDAPSGTYVHWLAWDIPAADGSLDEGEKPPVEGTNGSSRVGYTGPCPPQGGGDHRYFFTLYALDVETLSLPSSTRRAALEAALEGHVLGTAVLMGKYRRD